MSRGWWVGLLLAAGLAVGAPAGPGWAVEPLVVSIWGGNWKDTVEQVVARPFAAATGIPVEFEVGGTLDRLAKARVSKGRPLVDVTFTTSHVARLYISDGLYQKLDLARIPSAQALYKEAIRSDYHLGVWAYVYTIAYRTDLVKATITKWADLWSPQFARKIGLPDFDPSHIIVVSALLEGGNERNWQTGLERLKRLRPNIAAFYSTDAQSQDLMKTGEAPVQVMLSINAFHLQDQGVPVRLVSPTDVGGIVGIDTVGVMAGTTKTEAAYRFIDLVLSQKIQEQLVQAFKAGPVNARAAVPAALRGQPGIFTSPREWKEKAYIMDDEVRARNLPAWKDWFNANIVSR
jgi:putative spermidine/putrescine transport system substrate-binding protein